VTTDTTPAGTGARPQNPTGAVRGETQKSTRTALVLLGILLVLRLVYAAQLGLAFDEAYYWQWSRHLAASYYDQGPGIAYCIRFGTLLFGDTPLGVRFVTVLLGTGAAWLTFVTASRWAGEKVALATLALMNVAPLLSAGTMLATYDVPQVFFWAAALYALTVTLQDERPALWYGVGALVGLGLLCKLTMLLFAPCALIFLLVTPAYRRHLATPHPYLAFLLALAFTAPIFWWNAHHDWLFFKHTATLGNRTKGAPPLRWFGDFWGGQAVVLGPGLLLAQLWAATRRVRNAPRSVSSDGWRFFVAFFVPILLVCAVNSLRSKVEANWPLPMHLTGLTAVAALFVSAWEGRRQGARAAVAGAVGLSGLMLPVALFPGAVARVFGPLPNAPFVKLNEPYGWPEVAAPVGRARARLEAEGRTVFVAGLTYRVNSVMAFYVPGQPDTKGLFFDTRVDQYWLWTDPRSLVGQSAVFVLEDRDDAALRLARRYFGSVSEEEFVAVRRPGFRAPVKTYHVYECRDFKGYDPAAHIDGY
jgi:4-amino-4-deoxy-L-arabinose transferase-like glycosyltransferase